MTIERPMFPPATTGRVTSPSIATSSSPPSATRTTRRRALMAMLATGLAAGPARAIAGLGGSHGPETGTPLSEFPTGLATPSGPNPDAALLRMVEECLEAHRETERWGRFRTREDRKHEKAHPKSEAMRFRDEDIALGIPDARWLQSLKPRGHDDLMFYTAIAPIEKMRRAAWPDPESDGLTFTPSEAGRVRADEIVAAWDRWEGPEPTSRAYLAAEGKMARAISRAHRPPCESQVHGPRFYAQTKIRKERRSSLHAFSPHRPLRRFSFFRQNSKIRGPVGKVGAKSPRPPSVRQWPREVPPHDAADYPRRGLQNPAPDAARAQGLAQVAPRVPHQEGPILPLHRRGHHPYHCHFAGGDRMPLYLEAPRKGRSPNYRIRGTYLRTEVDQTSGSPRKEIALRIKRAIEAAPPSPLKAVVQIFLRVHCCLPAVASPASISCMAFFPNWPIWIMLL
jgi:hypothetical protein